MLALAPRPRTYPVLLPDRPQIEREPVRRRTRRRPLSMIAAMAVLAAVPAVVLVAQRTEAARTGYTILALRQQVARLQAEHDRLLATASALRAPDRVERIARTELGMVTPRPQQVAALPVSAPVVTVADLPEPSVWDRLAAWFVRSEAAAGEPSQ